MFSEGFGRKSETGDVTLLKSNSRTSNEPLGMER